MVKESENERIARDFYCGTGNTYWTYPLWSEFHLRFDNNGSSSSKHPLNTLAWGGGLKTSTYIVLGAIVIVGAYLILAKDNKGK